MKPSSSIPKPSLSKKSTPLPSPSKKSIPIPTPSQKSIPIPSPKHCPSESFPPRHYSPKSSLPKKQSTSKSTCRPSKHIHFQDNPENPNPPPVPPLLRTVVVERPKPTRVEMMPYVTKVNALPADQFCVPDFTDVESNSSLETTQSLEPPPVNYSTYPSIPHWLEIYNDTPSLLTYYNAVNAFEVRSSLYCVEIIYQYFILYNNSNNLSL